MHMHLTKVSIDQTQFPTWEEFPFNLPLFQNTKELAFKTPITIFTGENGSGKSTFLTAICRRCNIHIWEGRDRTPYQFNPYASALPQALDVKWQKSSVQGSFFSPELFKNYAQLVDEWAVGSPGILKHYGGQSLVTQSHEQSCMAYFKSIYSVEGLYFLDEPEAALSPKTELELLTLLLEMSKKGHAQFVIATHSPILMSCENATLYNFDNNSIMEIDYKDTQHFQIYNEFFKSQKN